MKFLFALCQKAQPFFALNMGEHVHQNRDVYNYNTVEVK